MLSRAVGLNLAADATLGIIHQGGGWERLRTKVFQTFPPDPCFAFSPVAVAPSWSCPFQVCFPAAPGAISGQTM